MYLTESKLEEYIKKIYPNTEWVHDKRFIDYAFRPDYVNHDLKIIVEFDGYLHYTKATTIKRDIKKDRICTSLGYDIIRVPYFVQMSTEVIKHLFNKDIQVVQEYEHGFISDDKTLILPCDFCELGIKKFEDDLERFSYIKDDIILSLENKAKKLKDWDLVLPPSLYGKYIK